MARCHSQKRPRSLRWFFRQTHLRQGGLPMCVSRPVRLRQQVRFLQRQFLQEGGLPFTNILSTEHISQALTAAEVTWKDRIYPPLVTLWVFWVKCSASINRAARRLLDSSLIDLLTVKANALLVPAATAGPEGVCLKSSFLLWLATWAEY